MSDNIILSKKHGLNPSVTHCFCCGRDIGIALFGKLKDDIEAPRDIYDTEPCDDCEAAMKIGRIFIEVENVPINTKKKPIRTGRIVGVKEEAAINLVPKLKDEKARIAYMEVDTFELVFGNFLKKFKNDKKNT